MAPATPTQLATNIVGCVFPAFWLRSYANNTSGGSKRAGYIDKYAAKDMAITALYGAPATALATACRMAHVVKTLVGLPMQVAIVKGLKRYL